MSIEMYIKVRISMMGGKSGLRIKAKKQKRNAMRWILVFLPHIKGMCSTPSVNASSFRAQLSVSNSLRVVTL